MTVSGYNSWGVNLNDDGAKTVTANYVYSFMGGKFGIGTTNPSYKLDVVRTSTDGVGRYAVNIHHDGNNNNYHGLRISAGRDDGSTNSSYTTTMIGFKDGDGTHLGSITNSGGTVSYNSFTGSHLSVSKLDLKPGMLTTILSQPFKMNNGAGEAIYEVETSAIANDSKILGTFIGNMQGEDENAGTEFKLISAVGNGEMWVVDNGTDLEIGDYLISSATKGHAMRENGEFEIAYIIGRVAEKVDWNGVTKTIDGKKHKLISVFFESFEKDNRINKLVTEIDKLKAENNANKDEIEALKATTNEIDVLKAEIEQLKQILEIKAEK
jgi:hypothetical protein